MKDFNNLSIFISDAKPIRESQIFPKLTFNLWSWNVLYIFYNFSANLIKLSYKLVWRTLKNFSISFTLPNEFVRRSICEVSPNLIWLHWILQFLKSIHKTLCNTTDVSLVKQSVFLKRGENTYNNFLFRWNDSLFIVNNTACVYLLVLYEIPGTTWVQ